MSNLFPNPVRARPCYQRCPARVLKHLRFYSSRLYPRYVPGTKQGYPEILGRYLRVRARNDRHRVKIRIAFFALHRTIMLYAI